jgi:hypothetical protein
MNVNTEVIPIQADKVRLIPSLALSDSFWIAADHPVAALRGNPRFLMIDNDYPGVLLDFQYDFAHECACRQDMKLPGRLSKQLRTSKPRTGKTFAISGATSFVPPSPPPVPVSPPSRIGLSTRLRLRAFLLRHSDRQKNEEAIRL